MVARHGGKLLHNRQEFIKTYILRSIAFVLRSNGGMHLLKRGMKRFS